jgi:peptidase E
MACGSLRVVSDRAIAQVEHGVHMIDVDAVVPMADEHGLLAGRARVRCAGGACLVALGGGGATHGLDAPIDDFVLQHLGADSPRVGFLDWARPDRAERLQHLRERLAGRCAGVDTLALDAGGADAARWLGGRDLLYVGGGDTARLLEALRHTPAGQAVVGAARAGLLLVGVSAGASVWFDCALSDAGGRGLRRLDGLGLLAGSFCPHFDSEPERRPAFAAAIARGDMPPGLAVDDGVAVLCGPDGPQDLCTARAGASAWWFRGAADVEQIRPNTGFLG